MMRIRIDGGALSSEQLRVVADISTDVRPRRRRRQRPAERAAALDPHRGRPGDLGAARSRRAVHHRGVRRLPARHARAARSRAWPSDSVLDAGPALREAVEKYLGDPAFSNLPRKYKTSISGCARHCTNHEINDCAFVGVIGPDGTPGFDLWVGGGLSTNPRFAERLGVFVRPDEVAEVWVGVTSVFRDYGYRRQRNHARLKFLMADWGPEKFREVLETEYLEPGRCPTARRRPISPTHRDHIGVEEQLDGLLAVGAHHQGRAARRAPRCARSPSIADRHAAGRVRLTAQQGLVVLDVAARAPRSTSSTSSDALGFTVRPSAFRRGTIACTGIEFCKLALVETKASRRDDPRGARAAAARTSTRRSRSTSTAARTPAPASRSPTSASRAWCRRVRTATRRPSRCTSADRWAPTRNSGASSGV